MGHFDWIVRNMPNVQRMYRDQTINTSLQPRLFLLAPQFSPLARCASPQIPGPPIPWVRFLTVEPSTGPATMLDPAKTDGPRPQTARRTHPPAPRLTPPAPL